MTSRQARAVVIGTVGDEAGAAMRTAGTGVVATFAYATLPLSMTRFTAYSLYRWEVAVRETVVGVVGAGGLGRLLEQQRAAFNYPGMLATGDGAGGRLHDRRPARRVSSTIAAVT